MPGPGRGVCSRGVPGLGEICSGGGSAGGPGPGGVPGLGGVPSPVNRILDTRY